ncbi:MAG: hemolysin secretion protein D [Betaproteobacteria bacterium RIFCSPLOWO2_02_67_12]|nr:MAG: hemolysin secretion protein D [Betaproteobacteria bacterium RIFCSPLOWO2_02_67_12]OGA30370.1 MAG: hemolysin secretion protein D [Betaproteobacteria bacterium RIFCSPLOWO2_02_FULL_68_150]OGA56602.1 MAG: hemolysin secretion protein D [Betaproteobacteria bacterium RIFCSPLOWO2_12_FULL_67_28]
MGESAAAAMQGPPAYSHALLWGVLAFVVAFFVWAAFANIGETTVGDGKVIPSSQVQVVQNLEGGIVAEIKVKVGDIVRKNQVLILIDDTRYASSFQENKAKNDALSAKIARLTAEVSGRPFELPARFRQDTPDLAERELTLYRSRQAEYAANTAVFTQQIDQRNQELREKRGRLTQINTSLEFLDKELSMSRPLVKQGAMSEVELLRLERQANDLKGELDSTRISIPRLESAVSEARQKLESYVAKFRADAQGDLNQVRAEQEGTAATSVALKDRVERAVVRSPVNGTVKSVKVTTIGGVVQPGSELMEIVPLEDNLLVEARVRPRDIAFLRPGQDALVKITAYDFSIYGGFPAKLEHISADSITDEKKGESYYLVQVRTTSNVPAARHEPLAIIPGMTATVHIQTGEKTFLHYLLKPIIKTREMAFRER